MPSNGLVFLEHAQNFGRFRVIARLPAHLFIKQFPVRGNHKHPAQLPGIPLKLPLPEPFSQGPHAVPNHPKVHRIRYTSLQACGSVRMHFRIDQQGKVQVLLVPKIRRVFGPSVADDHEVRTEFPYPCHHVAQLRNLLAAEQSPEVPDEDQNNGSILPESPEGNGVSRGIQHLNAGQPGWYAHLGASFPSCSAI